MVRFRNFSEPGFEQLRDLMARIWHKLPFPFKHESNSFRKGIETAAQQAATPRCDSYIKSIWGDPANHGSAISKPHRWTGSVNCNNPRSLRQIQKGTDFSKLSLFILFYFIFPPMEDASSYTGEMSRRDLCVWIRKNSERSRFRAVRYFISLFLLQEIKRKDCKDPKGAPGPR